MPEWNPITDRIAPWEKNKVPSKKRKDVKFRMLTESEIEYVKSKIGVHSKRQIYFDLNIKKDMSLPVFLDRIRRQITEPAFA